MAIVEAINIPVNVSGQEQLNKASDSINNLNKATKNVKDGLTAAQKSMELTGNASGGLKGKLDEVSKNFGKLTSDLSAIPGPVGMVVQGFTGLGKAMTVMLANPIGIFLSAIAAALYAVKRALSDSEEGQEKMNRITSIFGALLGNVTDLIAKFGDAVINAFTNPMESMKSFGTFVKDQIVNRIEGLIELFPKLGQAISLAFSGEFSAAGKVALDAAAKVGLGVENITDKIESAVEATKEFAAEQEREAKLADKVAQMRNKAARLERQLMIDRSVLEQQIAELRLKSRQEEEFTAEQRKQAILDAQKLEEQLLAKEVETLVLKRDAQKLENTFSRTNKENADKEAAAIAAVNQKIADRTNLQRGTQRELNRINKEIEAGAKAAQKDAEDRLKQQSEADKRFLEEALKNKEQFINKQFDVQKLQALQEIKNAEELAAKLQEIERNRTKNIIQARTDAGKETLDLQIKLADEAVKLAEQESKKKAEIDEQDIARKKAIADLEQEIFDNSQALAQAIINIAGENSKAGKAVALASIAADTARALSGALANSQAPTPDNLATGGLAGIAKYIALATTILSNSKRAYDIIKAPAPSTAPTGGAAAATAVPRFNAPTTRLQQNDEFTQVRRIFVTERDITNVQDKVRVTEGLSQF